jgi:hypothetical protein
MWWIAADDYWNIPRGSYAASGYGGHTLEVLPALNTVIVFRINTDDPRVELVGGSQVDQLLIQILRASDRAVGPYRMVERAMWGWAVLVAGSLFWVIWALARGAGIGWVVRVAWVLVTVFFGPIGLLAYLGQMRQFSRAGDPSAAMPHWQRALTAALGAVTGNVAGMVPLIAFFVLLLPAASTGLLAIVVPFTVGWLALRAPLYAAATGRGYWLSARRTLLAEAISSCLVLAGTLPVAITLEYRWFSSGIALSSPLFWVMLLLATFSGALVVYLLYLWMARRGIVCYLGLVTMDEKDRPSPTLRNAWGALVLGIVLLAIGVVLAI